MCRLQILTITGFSSHAHIEVCVHHRPPTGLVISDHRQTTSEQDYADSIFYLLLIRYTGL